MVSNQTAIMIMTTSDDLDELNAIAKSLIEKRLAACCQVGGPITSHYRWEGQVESSQEWFCTIKTLGVHFQAVSEIIGDLHHYDTPQIVSLKIDAGSEGYLDWIHQQVT